MSITWKELGHDYPGESPCARAVFDAIAPVARGCSFRVPGLDLGTELAATPEEVWNLSLRASNAVLEQLMRQRTQSADSG